MRESGKVFIFADSSHLLKLTRKHFDKGFEPSSSEKKHKSYVQKLLDMSLQELKFIFKFSQHHLDVSRTQRQKLFRFCQTKLSRKALEFIGRQQLLKVESYSTFLTTADTLLTQQACIRIIQTGTRQNSVRNGRIYMLSTSNGPRVTINSLKNFFHYLKEECGITSKIPTYKSSKDVLENVFFYIRSMECANDHPTPLDFKYRKNSGKAFHICIYKKPRHHRQQ
ncbi:hypothetical protein PR048_009253 [Dryococelus australis]|uniref:Transposable element P transposase n=1 Tax=Dryococelus australis TaxID=614101 RepID=A0ABQ9HZC6_9NEOP|nr:hypothetical protein PR048_009253 [Dryococelus australis]